MASTEAFFVVVKGYINFNVWYEDLLNLILM